ncbi:MAG: hypothetical protein WDO15_27530 [Bacteroidota bacterium]
MSSLAALQFNYLLLVVPFVFFAFGWAFHVILESKTKLKTVYLSALIGVTFIVDFLLAMIINSNTENAKALMGLQTHTVVCKSVVLHHPLPWIPGVHYLE